MSNPNGTPSGTNGSPAASTGQNPAPSADAPASDTPAATQPPPQAGPSTSTIAADSPADKPQDDGKKDKDKEKDKEKDAKDKEKQKDTKPDPAGPDLTDLFAARREEETARRDRSLAEFLVMLDGYKPLIPEEVTEYYLQRAGFECADPRLKRLLSLSAQKFVSDLSREAYHYAKLRVNGTTAGRGRPSAGVDRNRVVLTMDDLSLALGDHGVNVKKPDYYL